MSVLCESANEFAREAWERFLKRGGVELFKGMLTDAQKNEEIHIDVKMQTCSGKPLPEQVALMVLMRAAIMTIAIGEAIDEDEKVPA